MSALDIPLSLRLPKKTAKALTGAGVVTVGDLLMVAPRRYYHWGRLTPLSSLREGEDATILVEVASAHLIANRSGSGVRLEVTLTDGVQFLSATFFAKNQYKLAPIERILTPGQSFLFAGKVGAYRGKLQLTHPSFEGVDGEDIERIASRPIPIYPATGSLASWAIARAVGMVLDHLDDADVPDVVPPAVRDRVDIPAYACSLRRLHQPQTDEDYQQARRALAFTEAFVLQVGLAMRRRGARATPAVASPQGARLVERFRDCLPFQLTDSQEDAVAQISADLERETPMQRLLQGDVGSGKTVVALMSFLQVVAAGHQVALVAPTEVLAEQHTASLRAFLAPLGEEAPDVRLLTGSTTPAARREIQAAMNCAQPLIVVGTHALFQESVRFSDLALVVVDEQHRFGVEQRAALRRTREDGHSVHELVMTATPIPRTIAMTVFGDLDETRMSGMPRGRTPVATYLADAANAAWVERTWARAAEEIAQGRRVYVVCPRIDATDEVSDADEEHARPLASVSEVAAYLRSRPALAGVGIHELTGRTPAPMKAQITDAPRSSSQRPSSRSASTSRRQPSWWSSTPSSSGSLSFTSCVGASDVPPCPPCVSRCIGMNSPMPGSRGCRHSRRRRMVSSWPRPICACARRGMSWVQGSRAKPRTYGSSPFAAMNPSSAWPKKRPMRFSRLTRRWTIIRTLRAPFVAPPRDKSSGCNAPELRPVG